MFQFLLRHLVYPSAEFVFGFIGDRPWLALLILGLLAILIWRFALVPAVAFVKTFHTLFGWKGWALLAAFVVTFGAFGAGWRAHRDSIYPLPHSDDQTDKKPKRPVKPPANDNPDDWWEQIKKGGSAR